MAGNLIGKLPPITPFAAGIQEKLPPSRYRIPRAVLWAWNGKDTNQFANPITSSIASGTLTLSVVTGSVLGEPRLRMTASSFQRWKVWPIKDLILPQRYEMWAKFHADSGLPTGSDNTVWLYSTNAAEGLANSNLHGVQFSLDGAGTNYLIEAGARITASTPTAGGLSVGNADAGSIHEVWICRESDPIVGSPGFSLQYRSQNSASATQDATATSAYTHTFAGSWAGLTLNRAAFGYSTSNVMSGNIEVSELVISRYVYPWE